MAQEELRKRKSAEEELPDEENYIEVQNEPQNKVIRIDAENGQPNLENNALSDNSAIKDSPIPEESANQADISDLAPVNNGTIDGDDPPEKASDPPSSIRITFNHQSIAHLYKEKFLKFINSFIELEIVSHDELSLIIEKDPNINPLEWEVVEETAQTETTIDEAQSPEGSAKKRKKRSKVKKELFVVDVNPSSNSSQSDLRYTTKFTISTDKNGDEAKDSGPKQMTCFNCDQSHSLKDCPIPKDYSKINAARQKFARVSQKSSRYHVEEDQKYCHLTPGKLSHELRHALGLQENEIPAHVYLMRQHGYPPGWLQEAKLVHSDLTMFDIDGKHVKASAFRKSGLDPVKIVDYPGFNVPLEEGMKDYYRKHDVPPYSENFSKNLMLDYFEKEVAKEAAEEQEIEPIVAKAVELVEEIARDSPSLIDLEAQKRQLLDEINVDPKIDLECSEDFLAVKTSSFGTPILKSNSPYMRLPNPDNFSKDVSPVINFENLPNSTGKYEQMTDVLQKVRSTLKKLQNCNT